MRITINDDFDLYKITYSGQCFRAKQLEDDTYYFITGANKLTMTNCGNNEYDISCDKATWDSVWHSYFDMDTCYSDIRQSIPNEDSYMVNVANIGNGIRILRQDKFEALISFIISQRKNIPAIKSSVERLCSLYGKDGAFPEPDAMLSATYEELCSCGLGYRVPYIQDTVTKVAMHEINLDSLDELSDDELFDALKSFKGVGDKVANCVALFAYHRIGRAPIDTWINKVIDTQYKGINPFPKYGDFAGIMQQYMFYAAQHMHTITSDN